MIFMLLQVVLVWRHTALPVHCMLPTMARFTRLCVSRMEKLWTLAVVQPGNGDPGGYANAAAQDAFLANTIGWITKIYDQSGKGNHLCRRLPEHLKALQKENLIHLPIADMAPATIAVTKLMVFTLCRVWDCEIIMQADIAINDEPEGIYYVINGKHYS